MTAVLLDTHVWIWTLTGDLRLSDRAARAIRAADAVHVSAISFYEIGQKARLGRWPEVVGLIDDLPALLREQGGFAAALSAEICLAAATAPWLHRDPFDRLIAATADLEGLDLVSADAAFDTFPPRRAPLRRVW